MSNPSIVKNSFECFAPESKHKVRLEQFWDVIKSEMMVRIQYDDLPNTTVRSRDELLKENPIPEGSKIGKIKYLNWLGFELLRKHVNENAPDASYVDLAAR